MLHSSTYTAHRHTHARHIRTRIHAWKCAICRVCIRALYVNVRIRNTAYGRNRIIIIIMMMLSDNKNAILRIIRKSNICRRWFIMSSKRGTWSVVSDEMFSESQSCTNIPNIWFFLGGGEEGSHLGWIIMRLVEN